MPPDPAPVPLIALVADHERAAILAAANRLSLCLGDGPPPGWPIRIRFVAAGAPLPEGAAAAIIASLAIDAERATGPFADVAEGWRRRIDGWRGARTEPILLVSPFRYVADRTRRPGLAEHLRRLGLLAVDLSRERGAGVIDVDRTFALIGGVTLGTDHRGGGDFATEVAGQVIAAAIIGAGGLDGLVPPERAAAAGKRNGGRAALAEIAARHRPRAA